MLPDFNVYSVEYYSEATAAVPRIEETQGN
jgi:hypothetical protein